LGGFSFWEEGFVIERFFKIVGTFLFGIIFLVAGFSIHSVLVEVSRIERETVNQMKDMLPQIKEDFLLTQDRLDTLANGEFVLRRARAFDPRGHSETFVDNPADINRWQISFPVSPQRGWPREDVHYWDWHTIDWITDEEIEAIIFLASSREIAHRFVGLNASDWSDEYSLRADIQLYGLRYASLIIFYGYSNISPHHLFHYEHLGGGYYIYIYYGTPGVSLLPLYAFFGNASMIIAALLVGRGLLLMIYEARRISKS